MINDHHPFFFLKILFNKYPESTFNFSKYIYTPDTLFDERIKIEMLGKDISEDWIIDQLTSLQKNQEFAVHSNIKHKKSIMHIPMIDFSYIEMTSSQLFDRMNRYIPTIMKNLAIYSSGRSFHAYSTSLLPSNPEWIKYMGKLLLINTADQNYIVDNRWVGHRLIGGYSSLRWSNNSEQYLKMPQRVAYP